MPPQGHSVDDYLETIYFLAFPIGEYRPSTTGSPTLASRVAEMLGVSRASAGEMPLPSPGSSGFPSPTSW